MASEKLTLDRAIRILHPLTTRGELQGLCREDAIDMCESACLMVCIAAQFRIPVRPKKSDDGLLCHCPTCGRCVMATNYCGSCGQAFDLGGVGLQMSGDIMICQNCKWEIYEEGIGCICTNPDSDSCGLAVENSDWCYDFESE